MPVDSKAKRNIGLLGATGLGVGFLALAGVAFSATGPIALVAFALNGVLTIGCHLYFCKTNPSRRSRFHSGLGGLVHLNRSSRFLCVGVWLLYYGRSIGDYRHQHVCMQSGPEKWRRGSMGQYWKTDCFCDSHRRWLMGMIGPECTHHHRPVHPILLS